MLKEAGFNAIRSSHNPASSATVEACDEYGVYLIDETCDMWFEAKLAYDYAKDFERRFKDDIRTIVKRDFSHPSVICYSIGNEVSEPRHEKGLKIEKEIVDLFHQLDKTRPVTCGIKKEDQNQAGDFEKGLQPINTSVEFNRLVTELGKGMNLGASKPEADKVSSPAFDMPDIAGYNYGSGRYTIDPIEHPNRAVVGTETFPYEIAQNWELVKKLPHLIGDFMWTSWDYIGEAGIGAWAHTEDGMGFNEKYPWLLADSCAIYIIGNPNAELGYTQVVWHHIKGPYISVQPVNHPDVKMWQAGWRGTNAIPYMELA